MRNNWMRFSLLYKYLLSYVLVLIIPIIAMIIVTYGNFTHVLADEVEAENANMLSKVQSSIDGRMKELDFIAVQMASNPRLTPYMVQSNGYKQLEAIKELKNYKAIISSFVYEIFLYINDGDMLYSSSGPYPIRFFFNSIYRYEKWDTESFMADMGKNGMPWIRPRETINVNGTPGSYMTYLYPLPPGNSMPYSSVIFLMEENTFKKMIGDILKDYTGYVCIMDDRYRLIASTGSDLDVERDGIRDLIVGSGDLEGSFSVDVGKEDYSVSYIRSSYNGWIYMTAMPTAQFMNKVVNARTVMLQILILVIMFGAGLAVALSFANYRPIRRLSANIAGRLMTERSSLRGDELNIIANGFDSITKVNERLEIQAARHRPFIRERFLIMLLRGEGREQWAEVYRSSGISLERSRFTVMVVLPDKGPPGQETVQSMDQLIQTVEELQFDGAMLYGVELIQDSNAIALVVNGDEDAVSCEKLPSVADSVRRLIAHRTGIAVTIGVGRIYSDDLSSIHRSFIEALAALDYRILYGKSDVIFFEKVATIQKSETRCYFYPVEAEMRIRQIIKQGDAAKVKETLNEIMNSVKERNITLHAIRCVYFDVINTLAKSINELDIDTGDFAGRWDDIISLMGSGTIDELNEHLCRLAETVCERVARCKESRNNMLRDDIKAYVARNFNAYDLNLETIADHFGKSSSYISRFFKDQTGETLTEYINALRMDAVKGRLVNTDKAIKDIIEEVGFVDTTSFIRKFKRIEGITPGQYRSISISRRR